MPKVTSDHYLTACSARALFPPSLIYSLLNKLADRWKLLELYAWAQKNSMESSFLSDELLPSASTSFSVTCHVSAFADYIRASSLSSGQNLESVCARN